MKHSPDKSQQAFHPGVELLDSVLRFRIWRRIRFIGMFKLGCFTDTDSCRPLRQLLQPAFFFR